MENNNSKTNDNEDFRQAVRESLKDGSFFRILNGNESLPDDVCKLEEVNKDK